MPLTKVAIIGAGGHAREVLDIFDAINARQPTYDVLGYIVEAGFGAPGTVVNERPILGDFDWFARAGHEVHTVCAVGAPEVRRRLVLRAQAAGIPFCRAVHPTTILTRWVTIGDGVVVAAGCVLTNTIRIGSHALINVGCTVAHDSAVEDFATLAPAVHSAGNVSFGEGCNVGIGATIAPRRRIGTWATVGAGSVVVDDVPDNSTVAGVPARVRQARDPGWHLA